MECKITSFSPLSEEIFPEKPVFEKIAFGYRFTEGPVWDIADDCLYFTDFQNELIYRWTERNGAVIYRSGANRPIGLSMDAGGRIVSTESSMHRIAFADNRESEIITGAYDGKRLNSPNDVVVSRDGSIWFTDPYSTAMGAARELDINGVYRISGGETSLVYGGMGRPNGIAFSPDESILYVNDTDLQKIFSFRLRSDRSAEAPEVFATLDPSYGAGAPDGMKVDINGNVWVTGPGGVWVISPEGSPVAILHCPEFVGNLCFGGPDSRTLYITASTSVYRMPVGVTGIVPKRD